jgi:hypothetical protein
MRKSLTLLIAGLALGLLGCGNDAVSSGGFSSQANSSPTTPATVAGRYQGVEHEGKAQLDLLVDGSGQASGSYQLRQASADLAAGVYPISGQVDAASGLFTLSLGAKSGLVLQGQLPVGQVQARTFHMTGGSEPGVGTLTPALVGSVPDPNLSGTVTGLNFDRGNSNVEVLTNPRLFGFYVTPSRTDLPQLLLVHLSQKEGRGARDLFFQVSSHGGPLTARRYEITTDPYTTGAVVSYTDATPEHFRTYSGQSPQTLGHFTITQLTGSQIEANFQVDGIEANPGTQARGSFSVRGNLQMSISGTIDS